jgi:hypothetical protein
MSLKSFSLTRNAILVLIQRDQLFLFVIPKISQGDGSDRYCGHEHAAQPPMSPSKYSRDQHEPPRHGAPNRKADILFVFKSLPISNVTNRIDDSSMAPRRHHTTIRKMGK